MLAAGEGAKIEHNVHRRRRFHMASTENTEKKADLSWLVVPIVGFCLCIPAVVLVIVVRCDMDRSAKMTS